MGEFGIGQPVPREEDPYLVRGDGRYVDDVSRVGQARAYVLRSPHSHATIVSIDVEARAAVARRAARPDRQRSRRARARPAAAEAAAQAPRRLAAIRHAAAAAGARPRALHRPAGGDGDRRDARRGEGRRRADRGRIRGPAGGDDAGRGDRAGRAGGVGRVPRQHRLPARGRQQGGGREGHRLGRPSSSSTACGSTASPPASMEPRGCLAEYDPRDDRYTLRCTVQGPHQVRRTLAQDVFTVPETKVRVISDNVGGGFGMKGGVYPEYQLALLAAKLHRPAGEVDRRPQRSLPRPTSTAATTSPKPSSRSTRTASSSPSRVRNYCNIGAYNASDRSAGPPTNNIGVLAGTYTFPAGYVEVNGTFTNTMLTGPYRGAGRPEAAYVLETLVDLAARKLGIDPRRAAPPQHHPGGGDAVQDRAGLHLRLRRLRQEPRRLPRAWRTTTASRRAAGNRRSTASCAASASPTPSKPRTPA